MADKQQNILVNFKYNTAELERAQGIVNRANEATNKLQQSSQNAGKAIDQSFRGAASSLPNLIARQKELEDAIKSTKATNFATFKEFTKHLQGLSAQYSQVRTQIAAANKELANQGKIAKETSASTAKLADSFGQVFTAIKLVVGAGIAKELVSTTLEAAKLSGNVEGVERAFKRAFPGSVALMHDLQEATHGTVTEFELMQRTLQATNLGVAVEQLPILFEFAAARAQQTGESVDYLVDSIVRGIGRKSILVLDNLGLSATRLREQFNGASLASQSVADVTRGVAAIAKVELDKMGGYAETSATKVDQITVSWQKLRLELAKKITGESGGLMQFFQDAIDGTAAALKSNQELRQGIAENAAVVEFNSLKESRINQEKLKDQQKLIDAIQDEIRIRMQSIKENNVELLILKQRYDEAAKSREGSLSERFNRKQQIVDEGNAVLQNNLFLSETIKLLKFYFDGIVNGNKADKEQLGIIEKKKEQIKALQEAIEKTRNTSDLSSRLGVGKLITDLAVANAELKELLEGPENKEFKVKFDISKDQVLKDFENLTNILKGIPPIPVPVQPVPIVPKDFGDHLADAIKENQGELINAGTEIFADQLISFEEAEVASLQNRLNNLRNFYDEQTLLAGDNERAKKELRLREERETAALQKKIAQREKEARRFSVIIDTAAGIARAFATAPNIAVAIVQAALVAAQGASQLAIINRTVPRFAKGVIDLKGPGTGTSDSIDAKLSRGESVMTAKETQGSRGILKDIRAKKLDDKVLQNLKLTADGVKYVGMDDSRIVKEIRELKDSQPNLVEQSGMLYRQFNKGKDYRRKVRLKNMGY